jgi:beta-lactamase regulating signal transducer with metallopeptidase domain
MIGAATNHLWQSTLFAIAVGVLTLAFRPNAARVRHWLWFCASCKFLIPFSLLMTLGSRLDRHAGPKTFLAPLPVVVAPVLQISQPFSGVPLPAGSAQTALHWADAWMDAAIISVWACGFFAVALMRFRGWLRIRAALRASTPADIPAPIRIRSSANLFDPAIVGLFRPILLVPSGIVEHLRPAQWEAVLAHELCHARRRDNLTSALHMIVEAFFWFHPLVWWIGGRLVEERERACDEAVLSLGTEPRDYAEAIVGICQRCVKLPLECVSGVTGANLKKRIEEIMRNRVVRRLNFARKLALAGAGIAAVGAPILVGIVNSPVVSQLRAQSPAQSPQLAAPQITPADPPDQIPPAAPAEGRGAAPQNTAQDATPPTTAGTPDDDSQRRLKVLGVVDAMSRIWARYGMPDHIRASLDPGNPSQIWHYNYLFDFRSPVEFQSAPGGVRIVSPPPTATYYGEPGVSTALVESLNRESQSQGEPAATDAIAGLPGRHASLEIYPAKEYRMLSIPLDSLLGQVDVVAVVIKRSGASGTVVANVRDTILERSPVKILKRPPAKWPAEASPWQAHLALDPGSYVCGLVVRERSSGRIYGETIDFEVK